MAATRRKTGTEPGLQASWHRLLRRYSRPTLVYSNPASRMSEGL